MRSENVTARRRHDGNVFGFFPASAATSPFDTSRSSQGVGAESNTAPQEKSTPLGVFACHRLSVSCSARMVAARREGDAYFEGVHK